MIIFQFHNNFVVNKTCFKEGISSITPFELPIFVLLFSFYKVKINYNIFLAETVESAIVISNYLPARMKHCL